MEVGLRVLNKLGEECFKNLIDDIKRDSTDSFLKLEETINKINKPKYSHEFDKTITIDKELNLSNKMELGKYLNVIFNGLPRGSLRKETGLWSWLALVWFDKICCVKDGKITKIGEYSRYICSTHFSDYYRHLIAAPWDLYSIHQEESRLLLYTPLYENSDYLEQLAARQDIITNKSLIKVFDRLYWDEDKNRPKRGGQSRKQPGTLRRLINFIDQIELTYDLRSMGAEDIIKLLPSEFNPWINKD